MSSSLIRILASRASELCAPSHARWRGGDDFDRRAAYAQSPARRQRGGSSAKGGYSVLNAAGASAQLRHVQGRLGPGAPKVLVMPGSRKPVFHDRFLVIDDVVWASGPSFNRLGERIGLISRVHEPRIVIAAMERALARSTPLADWIAEAGFPQPSGASLMPRTFDDHLRDRRARVASWLEQRTEAETAGAVCEGWIEDLLARDLTLYSRQDIGSLPADLSRRSAVCRKT